MGESAPWIALTAAWARSVAGLALGLVPLAVLAAAALGLGRAVRRAPGPIAIGLLLLALSGAAWGLGGALAAPAMRASAPAALFQPDGWWRVDGATFLAARLPALAAGLPGFLAAPLDALAPPLAALAVIGLIAAAGGALLLRRAPDRFLLLRGAACWALAAAGAIAALGAVLWLLALLHFWTLGVMTLAWQFWRARTA